MIQTSSSCLRCGRPLKSLKSQEKGYGPTCAKKVKEEPNLIDMLNNPPAAEDEENFMVELAEHRKRVS